MGSGETGLAFRCPRSGRHWRHRRLSVEQLAALLDTEAEVAGSTTGTIWPLLKTIGLTTKIGEYRA